MGYGGDPGTGTAAQRRDAVRLNVGDTETGANADELLTDAEYDFLLLQEGDALLPASVDAANAIAAKFMKQARVAHGPSSVDPTKRADDYFELADKLSQQIGQSATIDAGGISRSDKESTDLDTDRVDPAFRIGMDDIHRRENDDFHHDHN